MDNEPIFSGVSAMPTGPFIPIYITSNPTLKKKTKLIVISGTKSKFNLRLYRESSSKPGYYSCDEYLFIKGVQVGPMQEDPIKYLKQKFQTGLSNIILWVIRFIQ